MAVPGYTPASQGNKKVADGVAASVKLQYFPRQWRVSKVVFISKAGKEDYAHPQALFVMSRTDSQVLDLRTLTRLYSTC
jgi:hypothetical protein